MVKAGFERQGGGSGGGGDDSGESSDTPEYDPPSQGERVLDGDDGGGGDGGGSGGGSAGPQPPDDYDDGDSGGGGDSGSGGNSSGPQPPDDYGGGSSGDSSGGSGSGGGGGGSDTGGDSGGSTSPAGNDIPSYDPPSQGERVFNGGDGGGGDAGGDNDEEGRRDNIPSYNPPSQGERAFPEEVTENTGYRETETVRFGPDGSDRPGFDVRYEEGAPSVTSEQNRQQLRQVANQVADRNEEIDRGDLRLEVDRSGDVDVSVVGGQDQQAPAASQRYQDRENIPGVPSNNDDSTTSGSEVDFRERIKERVAAQTPGASQEDVTVKYERPDDPQSMDPGDTREYTVEFSEDVRDAARQQATDEAASEVSKKVNEQFESATLDRGEDFTVDISRVDGQVVAAAELTDEGRKQVAKENAPLQGTPLEGITEAGAELNFKYEEFRRGLHDEYETQTEGVEKAFNSVTPDVKAVTENTPDAPEIDINVPSAGSVLGAAGAAVATPEPASSVSGVAVGAATLAGLGVASLAQDPAETTTSATATVQDQSEIPATGDPAQQQSELPADGDPTADITEIQTPASGAESAAEIEVPDTAGGSAQPEIETPTSEQSSPTTLRTGQQIVIGRQIEREERGGEVDEQDERTITRDDIADRGDVTIPERERVRQRQEEAARRRERAREDSDFGKGPTREYPTGEEAVVGRGSVDQPTTVEEPTVGTEPRQVQEPTGSFDSPSPGRPTTVVGQRDDQTTDVGGVEDVRGQLGVGVGSRPGIGERADTRQDTGLDLDLGVDVGLGTETAQVSVEEAVAGDAVAVENQFVDESSYPTGEGQGNASRSGRRPRRLKADSDRDDDLLEDEFAITSEVFDTGVIQSLEEIQERDGQAGSGLGDVL